RLAQHHADNSTAEKWHCPCYDRFRVREWEEESFLFNPASGDTHLLNALSMEILGLLERNRLSAEAIVSRLAQRSESVESQLLRDHLVEYLHQFEAMGLIISDQSCD
ncbi:MAG TPA: HPr-rel-A system PqqD family peptide chaperone, partial [Gammaproteobacteria bacterium]|nr:HPr-rel-A system PqqD family peptide chaperone [Gammaproteobacteria bacterium]